MSKEALRTGLSGRPLIQAAFDGVGTDRIPIWFMRQAGRYLPEYMELRKQYPTFEERCMNPEVATEITIQPITRWNLDAAVVFSDILIPIYGMNLGLEIKPGVGPVVEQPIRTPTDVENLIIPTAKEDFPYQAEVVRKVKGEIPDKAIIGFSGAPFTLASYLIEGKSTRDALLTKAFGYKHPKALDTLLDALTEIIIDQLQVQIDAGADFLQVFDSWSGYLSPTQFKQWAQPYLTRIFEAFTDTPVIFYAKESAHNYTEALAARPFGINVSHQMTLTEAHALTPEQTLLQGNLDPALLHTPASIVETHVNQILTEIEALDRYRYIFNLSTGINKDSTLEAVGSMVTTVLNFRRKN